MKIRSFASYVVSLVAFSMLWFLLKASLTTGNLTIGVILEQCSRPGTETKVTLIYETSHLASTASIISHLCQAFQQTGCELTKILPLATGSSFLDEELHVLKKQQRQVFVIHTSLELGIRLFQAAKKMDMTGDRCLWIATNGITDLFHSINSTMISSLNGMVGVKTYFSEKTPDFLDFRKRFRQKFRSGYPEDEQDEPGVFAVQRYNAVKLLEKISFENFDHKRPLQQNDQGFQRPLNLAHDYFPFYGSYDELWRRRHEYVDFTQPYTNSVLEMIVPIRSRLSNQIWLSMKPFTAQMIFYKI